MFFPAITYGCESWTAKKTEHWRIDAFGLQCWRRLLRDPWTARRSNQSVLKEINPEYSWKDWCWTEAPIFWLPDAKSRLIRKDPDAGRDWRQEEKEVTEDEMVGWHHWLNGRELEQTLGEGEEKGSPMCYRPWGCKQSNMIDQLHNNSTEKARFKEIVGKALFRGLTKHSQAQEGPGRRSPLLKTHGNSRASTLYVSSL